MSPIRVIAGSVVVRSGWEPYLRSEVLRSFVGPAAQYSSRSRCFGAMLPSGSGDVLVLILQGT